jgi:hypothetical protein
MERNVNAEATNKMHFQIYGLQYQTVNYLLSFCLQWHQALDTSAWFVLYRMSFYGIETSTKLKIYCQDTFNPLEEINY